MQRLGRHAGWAAVLALAVSIAAAAPAGAASGSKPYSLNIAPGTPTYESAAGVVGSGQTVGITATFKNETTTQQMGSANLFWPSGFNVISASSSTGQASVAKSCTYLGSNAGPCVQVRNLSLQPGQSVVVTMSVTTPKCVSGDQAWFAETKQANNYSGSPGNDLTFDAGNSQLNTTLDGACSLSWGPQPNNAQTGVAITSNSYAVGAAPAVTVLGPGPNPQPITTSTASVTTALADNQFATLSGHTTQTATGGTATFADLSISAPGTAYKLGASSGTLNGDTSSAFNITDVVVNCDPANPAACSASSKGTGNKAQINATPSTIGQLLLSVNANNSAPLVCPGNTSLVPDPNVYQFQTPDGWSKVVSLTIVPTKNGGKAQQLLNAQQICLGAPADFVTASGTLAPAGTLPDGTSGFIGLLPNCTGSSTGPCEARNQSTTVTDTNSPTGFDLVVVANIPATFAGDPHMG